MFLYACASDPRINDLVKQGELRQLASHGRPGGTGEASSHGAVEDEGLDCTVPSILAAESQRCCSGTQSKAMSRALSRMTSLTCSTEQPTLPMPPSATEQPPRVA